MAKNKNFKEKQAEYFDKQSQKARDFEETKASKFEFDTVLSFMDLPHGSEILELGCGAGRYSLKFLQAGYDVLGVDISTSSLRKLQDLYNIQKKPEWGRLRVSQKLPEEGNFDALVCVNILHHTEEPREMLIKAKRLLNNKGKIFIFEPNPFCLPWYLLFLFKGILSIEKNIAKTGVLNLKRMLKETGFVNIQSRPYGFIPTRLICWSGWLLRFSSVTLAKIPPICFFSFHNMVKAEIS